ncbi:hypothetical protein ACNSOL_11830 (plasmid) [Aliarcobacter lanthieri]|uniref:hypothetical protein n=1 Tax=Aliarcobacter lanthieri TaxID=1355374 RepID=UPI003AAB2F88
MINESKILKFIVDNQIFFTVFITIVILKFKDVSKRNGYVAGVIHIIGTFFHELSHYIVAIITAFHIPRKFSIFPRVYKNNRENNIELGHVELEARYLNVFNAFLIGMAPLLLLYLAYLVSIYFFVYYERFFDIGILSYVIYLFLIVTLIVNSIPSKADLKLAQYKGSIYFYILLIVVVLLIKYKNFI